MKRVDFRRWQDPFMPEERFDEGDELDDGYSSDEFGRKQTPYRGTYAITPVGLFPLSDANLPSRQFSFWVGDTNFDIDDTVLRAAERVPGVEILQAMTRYRFWLGIGRSFHDERVKESVRKAMIKATTPPGPPRFWAVVRRGGNAERVVGRSKSEIKKLVAGGQVLVTSWENHGELFEADKADGDGPGICDGLGRPGQQLPNEVDFPEVREQNG